MAAAHINSAVLLDILLRALLAGPQSPAKGSPGIVWIGKPPPSHDELSREARSWSCINTHVFGT